MGGYLRVGRSSALAVRWRAALGLCRLGLCIIVKLHAFGMCMEMRRSYSREHKSRCMQLPQCQLGVMLNTGTDLAGAHTFPFAGTLLAAAAALPFPLASLPVDLVVPACSGAAGGQKCGNNSCGIL